MTQEELKLRTEISEMQGDIRTVVSVLANFAKGLGLNFEEMNKPDFDIMQKLPGLVTGLMPKLMMGGMGEEFTEMKQLVPVLEKYKHLVNDIIPTT